MAIAPDDELAVSAVDASDTPAERERPGDRTRARAAVLNQLLFGAVVLMLTLLVFAGSFAGLAGPYFAGVVIVFIATAATLMVPWNRIDPAWIALIPTLDIGAILLMRTSDPGAGFGLLWVFPATWLASSLGLVGLIGGVSSICLLFWGTVVVDPTQGLDFAVFLLPLVVAAIATTSFFTTRRTAAQRSLLDKQAHVLGRALERTRRQEQALSEVLDAVDFGVIRIAPDGAIAVTNDAHGRMQHALQSEDEPAAFRRDGSTPLPPGELPLERALRGESFDSQLVWFGDPGDEDRRALNVTARRLLDSHGADAGAVIVSRDVTAEVTATRARDDLVASVSHELRTPLTSILGYLDLAIDDPSVPESARKGLEIAERNAERLLAIVADILAASSSSRSSVELTISPDDIDIAQIVRAAAESLLPRAAERAVTIDASGVESAPAHADSHRIRQVVDNLITNAIKYNRDGGTVTIGCTTDGESTWILVRDTGVGIAASDQARLFERFFRGSAVLGTGMKGTGLGLAISRDIVRAHGGDITVRSAEGAGSTFIVRLPAATAPLPGMLDELFDDTDTGPIGPQRKGIPLPEPTADFDAPEDLDYPPADGGSAS